MKWPRVLSEVWRICRLTVQAWINDKALRLGAALAFYTTLSLAPLVLVVIALVSLFFGEQAAQSEVFAQIEQVTGAEPAEFIKKTVENAARPDAGIFASLIGFSGLLIGATSVLGQLQEALNTIWGVEQSERGAIKNLVIKRLKSFALILTVGFLLLVSLLLSAAISAAGNFLAGYAGSYLPVMKIINALMSWLVITGLFAAIFKIMPDAKVEWKDVILGAVITSLLFSLGKTLIGLYLGYSAVGSIYGAAGSLMVLLIWVYYGSQILFLGAEFTSIYADEYGSRKNDRKKKSEQAAEI